MKKLLLIFSAALHMTIMGCAPRWHYAYDEAQRRARRDERDMLVFYKDPLDVRSSRMQDELMSADVWPIANSMVRCMLIPSYRPNRAFVAQFEVQQPPALIVVHSDGTYHALQGDRSPEEIRSFLASAQPPGQVPNLNPRIPQGEAIEYFNVFELANEKARRQNRRLVVIYKWWLHAESTELIRRLSQPDLARYFSDSVNCLLDWDYVPNRAIVARWGVNHYPALILVEPDGRYKSLVGLPSVESIVGFMVSHGERPEREAPASSVPQVVWFGDFDAAKLVAQRTGRNLFVYFHADGTPASDSASRLLRHPALQEMLASQVNCRMEWSNQNTRALAGRYEINSPPGCLLIWPDGTHATLVEPVTVSAIQDLISRSAAQPSRAP